MDLHAAEHLARTLMDDHGLTSWHFRFDNAVRRFGVCRYRDSTISMSRELTRLNVEAEVRDVILHEIAHALVGPGAGHGPKWRRKAREIGAQPTRCYEADAVQRPPAKYVGTCACPGKRIERQRLAQWMRDGQGCCPQCRETVTFNLNQAACA